MYNKYTNTRIHKREIKHTHIYPYIYTLLLLLLLLLSDVKNIRIHIEAVFLIETITPLLYK